MTKNVKLEEKNYIGVCVYAAEKQKNKKMRGVKLAVAGVLREMEKTKIKGGDEVGVGQVTAPPTTITNCQLDQGRQILLSPPLK